jgi:hypothetical protein
LNLRGELENMSVGAWAGYQVSFATTTGKPLPLEERFIPHDLIYWGQVPLSWELFTLDTALERYVLRVLPEVGCASENVATSAETSKADNSDDSHISLHRVKKNHVIVTRDGCSPTGLISCQTFFFLEDGEWPGGPGRELIVSRPNKLPVPRTRTRTCVEFVFDCKSGHISGESIVVTAMRLIDARHGGVDADNLAAAALYAIPSQRKRRGPNFYQLGIDARTVSSTIGGHCFVDTETPTFFEKRPEGSLLLLPGGIGLKTEFSTDSRNQPRSHLVISATRIDGSCASSVRREFSHNGQSLACVAS